KVFPVDYLLWAVTHGWAIYGQSDVKSAFARDEKFLREHSFTGSMSVSALHRESVAALVTHKEVTRYTRSMRKLYLEMIESQGGGHVPPRARFKNGGEPTQYSTRMFLEPLDRILNLSHGIEVPKDASELATLDLNNLSWILSDPDDLRKEIN